MKAMKKISEIRKEADEKLRSKKQVKPKRPISAFFFFTNENRKKIYEKNPKATMNDIA